MGKGRVRAGLAHLPGSAPAAAPLRGDGTPATGAERDAEVRVKAFGVFSERSESPASPVELSGTLCRAFAKLNETVTVVSPWIVSGAGSCTSMSRGSVATCSTNPPGPERPSIARKTNSLFQPQYSPLTSGFIAWPAGHCEI